MSATSNFFVSILCALHNDADILGAFFEEVVSVLKSNYKNYEFVLIDDGSRDDTPVIIGNLLKKHQSIRYVRLSRQFGKEEAISAGLDAVIGDVVVILDPQCDPPGLIPEMVERVRQTNGIVFGVKKGRKLESLLYRLGKRCFYQVCKMLLKTLPPENATFFIGLTHQSLNAIIQIKNESKFIRIFGGYVGFKRQIFEYELRPRRKKLRQKNLFEGVGYAISLVVNNTTQPLKIISYLGFFASLVNAIYIGYILLTAISRKRVIEGWMSSSFQVSIMFLFSFIIFTVLCEYLSRLFDDVRQRPYYFIEEDKNSSVMLADEDRRNIIRESNGYYGKDNA